MIKISITHSLSFQIITSICIFSLITGCTHKVEYCNVIDETPEKLNIVEHTPYTDNIFLESVKGGIDEYCHQEGQIIPNRILKAAIIDSLQRREFFSNSTMATYQLEIVLDPVIQKANHGYAQATVGFKATLRNHSKNQIIFNERFESTIIDPDDAGFWSCCKFKVATEMALKDSIMKLMGRLKTLAYPQKPSSTPPPIPPAEPGSPDIL